MIKLKGMILTWRNNAFSWKLLFIRISRAFYINGGRQSTLAAIL
jgi:hypothetical protein